MNVESILSNFIAELSLIRARQMVAIDHLQKELARKDARIAELDAKVPKEARPADESKEKRNGTHG